MPIHDSAIFASVHAQPAVDDDPTPLGATRHRQVSGQMMLELGLLLGAPNLTANTFVSLAAIAVTVLVTALGRAPRPEHR